MPTAVKLQKEEEEEDMGMASASAGGRFEMESVSEVSAVSEAEDTREKENKKRKINEESDHQEDEEDYVIGIVAERQINGIFSDPHAVAMFVVKKLGKVKSVRVTRRGVVVVECKNLDQVSKAMHIYQFGECPLEVFQLGIRESDYENVS